jgi:putative ATP-binding cassette transporter
MPAGTLALFLPKRPYLPIGTMRDVACYPSTSGAFADTTIREALVALGLDRLATQLDVDATWDQQLSGDEQQRVSIARVLLHEPDWIFMDDAATSALDEAIEKQVYDMLAKRLPRAAVVSMTRRAAAAKRHAACWTLMTSESGQASLVTA